MKQVERYVKIFDMFATPIQLRFKKHNEYRTLTGAFFSLIILILCLVLFFEKFQDTSTYTTIFNTIIEQSQSDPSYYSSNKIMFAVSIGRMTKEQAQRFFSIQMIAFDRNSQILTNTTLPLQPCTMSQWAIYGPTYADKFNQIGMSDFLCPKTGQKFQIQGKFTSEHFKYVQLNVNRCTGSNCADQAEFENFVKQNQSFILNFYFVKQILNPALKNAINFTMEDRNYFTFTTTRGNNVNLYFEKYLMQTDYSLWPEKSIQYNSGIIFDQAQQKVYDVKDTYLRLCLRKSEKNLIINRSFYKYTDLLSYIGGLFGILMSVGKLIFESYNICCFQLSLATQVFVYQRKDSKEDLSLQKNSEIQQEQPRHSVDRFNFWTYLCFLPYRVVEGIGWRWQKIHPFYEALESIKKEIDINRFIERFMFYDRMVVCLLNEHQINILHVKSRMKLPQFEQDRQKYRYHKILKISKQRVSSRQAVHPKQTTVEKILFDSYRFLQQQTDPISKSCIEGIDPFIKNKIMYDFNQMQVQVLKNLDNRGDQYDLANVGTHRDLVSQIKPKKNKL